MKYSTNHGIPKNLLQQLELQTHHLCCVPKEAKQKVVTCDSFMSYHQMPKAKGFTILNLPESDSIHELFDKIWPEGKSTNFSYVKFQGFLFLYTFEIQALAHK